MVFRLTAPASGSPFDGGAANLPANALSANDNPGYVAYGQYTNFIGAIDSSGFFSSVTFFGDGFGEVLYAGGTLRFAWCREVRWAPFLNLRVWPC